MWKQMRRQRLMAIIVMFLVLAVASASSAFAFKNDKEIIDYVHKRYPIIKEENITISVVTMAYVNWAGLYTPNKIKINKFHIFGNKMLDWVMKHEIKHHNCLKNKKNIDVNHKICF